MKIDNIDLMINEQTLKPWAKYVVNIDVQDFMDKKSTRSRADFAEWFLQDYEFALDTYNAIKIDDR